MRAQLDHGDQFGPRWPPPTLFASPQGFATTPKCRSATGQRRHPFSRGDFTPVCFSAHRLHALARSQDPAIRRGALQTLLLAGEQGVLLALREELTDDRSEWASEVRRAYREVRSPATLFERTSADPRRR